MGWQVHLPPPRSPDSDSLVCFALNCREPSPPPAQRLWRAGGSDPIAHSRQHLVCKTGLFAPGILLFLLPLCSSGTEVICKTVAGRGFVNRRSQRVQSVLAYYAERQGGKGAALAFGCHEVTGWSEAEVLQSTCSTIATFPQRTCLQSHCHSATGGRKASFAHEKHTKTRCRGRKASFAHGRHEKASCRGQEGLICTREHEKHECRGQKGQFCTREAGGSEVPGAERPVLHTGDWLECAMGSGPPLCAEGAERWD